MDNLETDIKNDSPAPDDIRNRIRRHRGGRIWVPVLFVLAGTGLLLKQMNLGIPDWIFSWQILLITVGIFSGLTHGFRGPGWLIMILVGTFFLLDQMIPGMDFHRFIWPAMIILVGLIMLLRPKHPHWMDPSCQNKWRRREIERWQRRRARRGYPGMQGFPGEPFGNYYGPAGTTAAGAGSGTEQGTKNFSPEDFIDATAIFGGIHKNILSKNFRGGDITVFMGGAEINLSQADIQGTAALDITQVMGGTKIIVPANWEIRSQLTSVFGSIEDKRQNVTAGNTEKVLLIDGSSVFGGIEIRSY